MLAVTTMGGPAEHHVAERRQGAFVSCNSKLARPKSRHDVPEGTANGWLVNKATVAKYVNKDAPAGATQVKVAVVKPGTLVKIVAKGLGDTPIDVPGPGDPAGAVRTAYCVDNAGEENCHCSELTGCTWTSIAGGTGAKLVCKAGSGDAACQADPTTSCQDGDAECPAGCGLGNDDDCTSCFVDLGLTVLDTCTNPEWEKKDGDDGTPGTGTVNAANLHDVDNRYAWAGQCTVNPFVYCQPNTAAAATCAAQAGAVNGCGMCSLADGTCDVQAISGPGVVAITTVWDWLNQLNAATFAGHGDWRLPTTAGTVSIPTGLPAELESIRDASQGVCGGGSGACIDPVFGPTAIGPFGTYWSGVPASPPTSDRAWHVEFDLLTQDVV